MANFVHKNKTTLKKNKLSSNLSALFSKKGKFVLGKAKPGKSIPLPTPVAIPHTIVNSIKENKFNFKDGKKRTSSKMIVGAFTLLLVFVGTVAAFGLSQQNQDVRQQAWEIEGYDSSTLETCPDYLSCIVGTFQCEGGTSKECKSYSPYCNKEGGIWRNGGKACEEEITREEVARIPKKSAPVLFCNKNCGLGASCAADSSGGKCSCAPNNKTRAKCAGVYGNRGCYQGSANNCYIACPKNSSTESFCTTSGKTCEVVVGTGGNCWKPTIEDIVISNTNTCWDDCMNQHQNETRCTVQCEEVVSMATEDNEDDIASEDDSESVSCDSEAWVTVCRDGGIAPSGDCECTYQ